MSTAPDLMPRDPVALERWRQQLLRTKQLAEEWQVSEDFLQRLRTAGGGPPFRKIGRTVAYMRGDAYDWLETQKFQSTASYREFQEANKAAASGEGP